MPVIVCTNCNLQMRPKKIGLPLELMTTDGPYQLYMSDKFFCENCGHEVAAGIGKPLAEHFEADYAAHRESYNTQQDGPVVRYWATQREKQKYENETPKGKPR